MDSQSPISSVRITKRKLEDAIRSLDGALVPSSLATATEGLTPSKRPHLRRSVYSTLIRLGGTSKEPSRPSSNIPAIDISKSAPHLASILARSELRHERVPPLDYQATFSAHPASEYRPSSLDSLLYRLSSYKITTYASKPSQIDAVAAARCGWINDGKDRLVCGVCSVSWVLAGREGMSKDAAGTLVEKQRVSLVEMHKNGCPWKARQCEPSVYRVPLQAPVAMVHKLRETALSLGPTLANVAVKHPLSSAQLCSLYSIFCMAASEESASEHNSIMDFDTTIRPVVPSDTATVVALFGWIPAPIATPHRPSSVSYAGPFVPSVSMPPTPSLSRRSSISSHFRGRMSSSTPFASSRMTVSDVKVSPDHTKTPSYVQSHWPNDVTAVAPRDTSLVYCVLCQRRVGLWGYSKNKSTRTSMQDERSPSTPREDQKEFDLVKEHRSYCPYVVCSSVVPSFPHSSGTNSLGSIMEGWRTVLTVVQRYELSQRQRVARFLPNDEPDSQVISAELERVEAMVTGVKTNGVSTRVPVARASLRSDLYALQGRELLRYVKTLLG